MITPPRADETIPGSQFAKWGTTRLLHSVHWLNERQINITKRFSFLCRIHPQGLIWFEFPAVLPGFAATVLCACSSLHAQRACTGKLFPFFSVHLKQIIINRLGNGFGYPELHMFFLFCVPWLASNDQDIHCRNLRMQISSAGIWFALVCLLTQLRYSGFSARAPPPLCPKIKKCAYLAHWERFSRWLSVSSDNQHGTNRRRHPLPPPSEWSVRQDLVSNQTKFVHCTEASQSVSIGLHRCR